MRSPVCGLSKDARQTAFSVPTRHRRNRYEKYWDEARLIALADRLAAEMVAL